jgi:hypothetical protein
MVTHTRVLMPTITKLRKEIVIHRDNKMVKLKITVLLRTKLNNNIIKIQIRLINRESLCRIKRWPSAIKSSHNRMNVKP